MLTAIKNNRSLTFYQTPKLQRSVNVDWECSTVQSMTSATNASMVYSTVNQTNAINNAYLQLRSDVIGRGLQYANGKVASRGGFMAENWHAGTYNLDATIKKVSTRATVPAETKLASADIVVDDNTEYSLKYYKDASSSANAQTNPGYKGQKLLIPDDQLDEAKQVLGDKATHNEQKGRFDAAAIQKDASNRLTDRVTGPQGTESTPLSKEDDLELAKAIKSDKTVDENAIDKVFEKRGVTAKKDQAIRRNEINGLKAAVAIAAGVGLTIGIVSTLAQSGISLDSVKAAVINGLSSSLESGSLAAISFGVGRTLGETAKQAIIGHLGTAATDNIVKMVDMGVIGGLSILVFSVYQFTKLKIKGVATRHALVQVGKQALISLSILTVSIAAQGVFGGAAGMIVATAAGLITVTYSVADAVHQRNFAERIRIYTIEQYTPYFA